MKSSANSAMRAPWSWMLQICIVSRYVLFNCLHTLMSCVHPYYIYSINGASLKVVERVRDLGVINTPNLNPWAPHPNNIHLRLHLWIDNKGPQEHVPWWNNDLLSVLHISPGTLPWSTKYKEDCLGWLVSDWNVSFRMSLLRRRRVAMICSPSSVWERDVAICSSCSSWWMASLLHVSAK